MDNYDINGSFDTFVPPEADMRRLCHLQGLAKVDADQMVIRCRLDHRRIYGFCKFDIWTEEYWKDRFYCELV